MPIVAQDEDEVGVAHHLTIRNVRCVSSISDSLLSILKLWDDERCDCLFRDVCHYKTISLISSLIISSELIVRSISLILEGIRLIVRKYQPLWDPEG